MSVILNDNENKKINSLGFDEESIKLATSVLGNVAATVNSNLINHPGFKIAFVEAFLSNFDPKVAKVKAVDDKLVIESETKSLDAVDGDYKGYRDAKKCTLFIDERNGKKYLIVKCSSSRINVVPNSEKDDVEVYSNLLTYDNDIQVGYAAYKVNDSTIKEDDPHCLIPGSNRWRTAYGRYPDLDITYTFSGIPILLDGIKKWESYVAIRNNEYSNTVLTVSSTPETSEQLYCLVNGAGANADDSEKWRINGELIPFLNYDNYYGWMEICNPEVGITSSDFPSTLEAYDANGKDAKRPQGEFDIRMKAVLRKNPSSPVKTRRL